MPHAIKKRRLLLPPLLAFAASALFIFFFQLPQPYGDSPEYFALASSIAQGHGFTADGAGPDTYRPPLFSFCLGLWFAVFGGPGLLSAALFQSFIFALSTLGVFLLARLWPVLRHASRQSISRNGWALPARGMNCRSRRG